MKTLTLYLDSPCLYLTFSPLVFVMYLFFFCLNCLAKHDKVSSMTCLHLRRAAAPLPLVPPKFQCLHFFNFWPSMPPLLLITPRTPSLKTALWIALLQRLQNSITLRLPLHLPSAMRSTFETRGRPDAYAWMNPILMSRRLRTPLLCLYLPPSMTRKLPSSHPRSRCPTVGFLKFLLDHLRVLVSFNFLGFSDFHP